MRNIYVDLHSHILPGVDDGAQNMDTSMEMLSMAYEQGVRHQFLTPHYIPGDNSYKPGDLDRIFEELSARAVKEFPEMRIYLGNEIYYMPSVVEDIRKERIHTMAGSRYVLVEFGTEEPWPAIEHAVRELIRVRVIPVIAHVERYSCLVKKESRLQELRQMDVFMQLNAGGIPGGRFDRAAGWRRRLVTGGWISFLGTDAHDVKHRNPRMREAAEWLCGELPERTSEKILWQNGQAVINHSYIDN